ncbi:FAD-dependent oxidoreductase [Lentisphaera marina]|uniref:FAD-dependent oxidoreductase n=1 Tax=Lentisphaera marina TaxID=1111041 RepID=UPI003B67C6B2
MYDAVVVATTTRAMSYMGLIMPMRGVKQSIMPDSVKVAIRNLHITSSSKKFIRTRSKFWLATETNKNSLEFSLF